MRRYIITGAPGAGKTAIIRQLELEGFGVVEEAAADVIAAAHARGMNQPWTDPMFIDIVANLQRDREIRASYQPDELQFHDRCTICTAALAAFLGYPVSPFLAGELERVRDHAIFENRVFFIRSLGLITHSQGRRITYDDAIRCERIHEKIYLNLGFELIFVEPASLMDRIAIVKEAIASQSAEA